jgi:hypothetical protein
MFAIVNLTTHKTAWDALRIIMLGGILLGVLAKKSDLAKGYQEVMIVAFHRQIILIGVDY